MNTIEEAKQFIRDNCEKKGVSCPVCNQLVKIYNRKFNSGMARILIEIFRYDAESKPENGYFHIHRVMTARRLNATNMEYSKLKYWGFIESKKESALPEKKSTGFWRITEKGKSFVQNKIMVYSHIVLDQNGRFLGYNGEYIDIRSALGQKFNYSELMYSYDYNEGRATVLDEKPEQVGLF
jgi:hypothetical protein